MLATVPRPLGSIVSLRLRPPSVSGKLIKLQVYAETDDRRAGRSPLHCELPRNQIHSHSVCLLRGPDALHGCATHMMRLATPL
ncbi:unnamed protein product, partial [Iphiclides podalirius]